MRIWEIISWKFHTSSWVEKTKVKKDHAGQISFQNNKNHKNDLHRQLNPIHHDKQQTYQATLPIKYLPTILDHAEEDEGVQVNMGMKGIRSLHVVNTIHK